MEATALTEAETGSVEIMKMIIQAGGQGDTAVGRKRFNDVSEHGVGRIACMPMRSAKNGMSGIRTVKRVAVPEVMATIAESFIVTAADGHEYGYEIVVPERA